MLDTVGTRQARYLFETVQIIAVLRIFCKLAELKLFLKKI